MEKEIDCTKCRYEDLITSMSLKVAFKKGYIKAGGKGEFNIWRCIKCGKEMKEEIRL